MERVARNCKFSETGDVEHSAERVECMAGANDVEYGFRRLAGAEDILKYRVRRLESDAKCAHQGPTWRPPERRL